MGSVPLDSEATSLAAGRSQATSLTVLVDGVADPVDSRVVTDADVVGVNQDNLEILVGGIGVHPVRVEDSHVAAHTANSLLSNAAEVSGELKLVDTLVLGLTVDNALGVGALASTSADSNSEHRESLQTYSIISHTALTYLQAEYLSTCLALYPSLCALSGRVG